MESLTLRKIYISKVHEARNLRLEQFAFRALREAVSQKLELDHRFCQVLNMRRKRIIVKMFDRWHLRYLKVSRRNRLERLSQDFMRYKFVHKYMSIWLRKLSKRLKKKHLKKHVVPMVQLRAVVEPHFRAWNLLYQKSKFLDQQLVHIDGFQNRESMADTFARLKAHAVQQRRKKDRMRVADQQYVYQLGRRVWTALHTFSWVQTDKRALYAEILRDFMKQRKAAVLRELRRYVRNRQDTRMSDLLL